MTDMIDAALYLPNHIWANIGLGVIVSAVLAAFIVYLLGAWD